MAAKNPKEKRVLKTAASCVAGHGDPFPGIPLKYVVTEDMHPDDIRALTDRAGPNGTIRKVLRGGSTVTFKPDRDLKADKSDSNLPVKKSSNEKGKEKEKTKEQLNEERHRYDFLGEEDLTSTKNPKRFELLFPATRHYVENAGISGEEAEKDPVRWSVLLNSLRFLKVDEGLKFANAPSKWRQFSQEEEEKIVTGYAPPKGFKMQKVIGEGAYGAVYACKCSAITDKPIAVKKLPHITTKDKNFNFNEVFFLSTLTHPTVVRYHASYVVKEEIWIITEMLEGGPLSQAKADYDESNIAFAAREILRALVHLHSNQVIHRDLKSENIMFSVAGEVKLIDFGLAASVADGPLIQMCGSPFWLSPEMIRMDHHSYPTDIWSFAISLLEMINGHPPNRDNILGLMYSVGSLKEDDASPVTIDDENKWSPEMREFLKLALIPSPETRLSASALLEHPFLKKACKKVAMSEVLRRIFVITALEDSFF